MPCQGDGKERKRKRKKKDQVGGQHHTIELKGLNWLKAFLDSVAGELNLIKVSLLLVVGGGGGGWSLSAYCLDINCIFGNGCLQPKAIINIQ